MNGGSYNLCEKKKCVNFTDRDKYCIMMGVCLGMILTLMALLLYLYLPETSVLEQTAIVCFIGGGVVMYVCKWILEE